MTGRAGRAHLTPTERAWSARAAKNTRESAARYAPDHRATRLTTAVTTTSTALEVVPSPIELRWRITNRDCSTWGNRSILFRDPDGNLVNLFTPVTGEAIKRISGNREP
jgi:hypothetical protein